MAEEKGSTPMLQTGTLSIAEVGASEVLARVHASGVNPS
jgi:NADPH:quinone reductase-like Zn-dependent oxidoreductase